MKQLLIVLIALCSSVYSVTAQTNAAVTTASVGGNSGSREQDGLSGPVRRVRVETANIVTRDGKSVELPRSLIEASTYDAMGRKTDSVAYPVEGASAPGKEEYKYDEKGNIIEMTFRGDDGSVLSKEKYKYEFDEFGNWKKMTVAVALYENGTISYEPTEVTYRTLTYYYGPVMPKTDAPAASLAAQPLKARTDSESKPVATNPAPMESPSVVSAAPNNPVNKSAPAPAVGVEANASKEDVKLPVLRVSEEVLRKAAIELPQPQYPANAAIARVVGPVEVQLIINQNGEVTTAQPVSGNQLLFDAATSAASKARFLMSAFSDHPTMVYGVLTYNFAQRAEVASIPTNTSSTTLDPRVEKTTQPKTSAAAAPSPVSETTGTPLVGPPLSNNNSTVTDMKSFAGYFNKGITSLASGKYEDAVEALTQAVKLNPQDAIAQTKLGLAYSALGAHQRAITAFKQAIKLNRAFVDDASYFRLGSAYLALSDYVAAIEPLKQALNGVKANRLEGITNSSAEPGEAEINYALGRAYYGVGSYRQAVKAFETAVRLEPNFVSAHYGLGLSYLEIGDKHSVEREEQLLRNLNSPLANRLSGMLVVPAGQRNKVF